MKCINTQEVPTYERLTFGKIYQGQPTSDGSHFVIVNDNGQERPYMMSRFEKVEEKSLEIQLQEARDLVADLRTQIDAAYDEINRLGQLQRETSLKIEVGQKYKHDDGSIYMVCMVGQQYALICIEEEDKEDQKYLGDAYHGQLFDFREDVFGNTKEYFTLLK